MEEKFSSYVFLRITEAIEVTQEINNTGIIPLEALRTQPHIGLTKGINTQNFAQIFIVRDSTESFN